MFHIRIRSKGATAKTVAPPQADSLAERLRDESLLAKKCTMSTTGELATIVLPDKADIHPYFRDACRELLSGVLTSFQMSPPGPMDLPRPVVDVRRSHHPRKCGSAHQQCRID
jgi:hypothetical protein